MPNKISRFWQELKRRKVLRVITVYAAVAFVILQLVEILAPSLRLPDWTMNLILVILIVGFIISVIISWIYDINPEGGVVKTEPVDTVKAEDVPKSSNGWKIASYISFAVIVGLIILNVIPRTNRSDKREIPDKSIAVLPFTSLSDDPDKQYQADGVMDAILLHLSKVEDLRVMARTSVEQYRKTTKTATEICDELDVAYLLEGSFQKYGDHARLIVQLIQSGVEGHVWANNYDREWKDIFAVQSEIAQLVAIELQAVITPEEKQLIEKVPTANLTAYDYFQRGREAHWEYFENWDSLSLERAEKLYQQALIYDSTYAQAYTGLAWVYWNKHYWETFFAEDFLDSVLILSNKALAFDNQLSEAYLFRGVYYDAIGEKEKAWKEYDMALRLSPNSWMALVNKGNSYSGDDLLVTLSCFHQAAALNTGQQLPYFLRRIGAYYGRSGFRSKAEHYLGEALKLDQDSIAHFSWYYTLEMISGNYRNALRNLERLYAWDPEFPNIKWTFTYTLVMLEEYEKAYEWYQNYKLQQGGLGEPDLFGLHRIGLILEKTGHGEEAGQWFDKQIETLKELDALERSEGYSRRTAYDFAATYAYLGDKEMALKYLEVYNQVKTRDLYELNLISKDPLFDSIRDEPEFQQILREVEAKYQAEHQRVRQWLEENELL